MESSAKAQYNSEGFQTAFPTLKHRRMFNTRHGYIGLAPNPAERGDRSGIFTDSKLPLAEDSYWHLIGGSYVHGMMNDGKSKSDSCELIWFA